jgi:hypothetical protein
MFSAFRDGWDTLRTMPYRWIHAIVMSLLISLPGAAAMAQETSATAPPAQPTRTDDRLLAAARAGGEYLVRMTEADGQFIYSYDPQRDRPNVVSYNMLRHAGSIYSMCELYAVTRDAELLAAIERAIGYMKASIRPYQGREEQKVLLDRFVDIKLGGNGLGIIALAEYAKVTGSREDLELMRQLARWMVDSQSPAGEFTMHIVDFRTGKKDSHVSAYYPGEAILALLRLHDLDPDPKWLDSAEKAAEWLIEVRDKGVPVAKLPHDHWLLYGLNELHRKRPRDLWLNHAEKITTAMMDSQHGSDAPDPQWAGGWYVPARTTPTSTRVEGLLAATSLFRDHGRPEVARRTHEAALRGIDFFLRAQHHAADDFPNPARAAGGFGETLADDDVRIDYVQHAISALLAARRLEGR